MDEQGDMWEQVITVLIAIGVAVLLLAATALVQPWLASHTPPIVPSYIFPRYAPND